MNNVILVFGEDENDRRAITHLIYAIRPDLRRLKILTRRSPVVHLRQADLPRTKRAVTDEIVAIVRAENVRNYVAAVIVHQDCDACEPAHDELARHIENVGMLQDAKSHLRRALRPARDGHRCPDYSESDSIKIAEMIASAANANDYTPAVSHSYERFRVKVQQIKI